MHTSLLRELTKTEPLLGGHLEGAMREEIELGPLLAIAAWKKGGVVSRGAGSTALFVYSTSCW